ncbi:MAG: septum formation protein Maf [Bdellovibrionaceae bacterium]|nr:septum formation protein Maf [Pseudobdellovibrionaceae bacterium]
MYKLILVSQSPRRTDILAKSDYNFRTDSVKVSEIIDKNLNLDDAIKSLARQKAEAYIEQHNYLKSQKILILTADTMVVFQNQALGKPKNSNDAFRVLSLLSGKMHSVKTSICVYDLYTCQSICELATTQIMFKNLSESEIKEYIKTGEPMDKAGSYGIQGLAAKFVESRDGDYNNVVGFPLFLFEQIIKEKGWKIDKRKPR